MPANTKRTNTKPRFIPKPSSHRKRNTSISQSYTEPSENAHITSEGLINPDLYGETLNSYCRYNKSALKNAELRVATDEISRELNERLSIDDVSTASGADDTESQTDTNLQSWQYRDTRIKYNGSLDRAKKDYFVLEDIDDREGMDTSGPINGYCYLCTTQEEHKAHLKSEKKIHGKPRREYVNPVKPELLPIRSSATNADAAYAQPGPNTAIYRVTVKTGNIPECGTNATVTMRMFGSEAKQKTKKMVLKKPGNRFLFMRGSTDVFRLTAKDILDITAIEVETDGYDKSQSWYLESVHIVNMKTKKEFYFPCSDWLSLFHRGETLVRTFPVAERKQIVRDYQVTVVTGNLKHSGTDSKVYLTLVGTTGRRSKRFCLSNKNKHCFRKGSADKFEVKSPDIGNLKKIRIEHDGKGKSRRWLLTLVLIEDLHAKRRHLFYCNQWLINEEGNALWREISSSKVPADLDLGSWTNQKEGEEVLYEVTIHTGDVMMAGTDANVHLQLYGEQDSSEMIDLSEIRGNRANPFEKNQEDIFQFKAKDVGDIRKLKIGHDNKGIAAGWYLEKVVVRKFIDVKVRVPVEENKMTKKQSEVREKPDPNRLNPTRSDPLSDAESSTDADSDNPENISSSRKQSITSKEDLREGMKRVTSSVITKVTKSQLRSTKHSESDSTSSDSDVTTEGDSDSEEENLVIGSKKTGKSKKKTKRKDLSDLEEVSELSSGDTSIWDDNEYGHRGEKQVLDIIRLKKEHDRLSATMEKIEAKVEEYLFICKQWLADSEGDGKIARMLRVADKKVFNRSDDSDDDSVR